MISPEKKMVAERWFHEYFTQGNVEVIDELTTEDFVYHSRIGDNPRETMKRFMEWYRSVFHDDEWELNDFIEQENKLAVRYTGWMTYKGGWFDIPANDQRVKETGMMIFLFEGGRVKELWCENSDAAILNELGAFKKDTHEVF
ncbi:ester cyclase [Planomicrobium sp. CPCC 101079]|uniref:ester cyclase n=1 Tax=Planomicrobium sp. CPCC 101079 TaxID=2599618 RepID=UPI0011B3C012|nr:nuclear transport factor 2 family protein [Planomicrobium sp. CPCC 101079]TWT13340.1 ester cyclase [Planomicrobium sp. CPCC 101079]